MITTHDFDTAAVARRQRARLAADCRDDELLIRCAVLAASSHDTQPWTFRNDADSITIQPDTERRFRRELLAWIRFNPAAALRSGDGLAGRRPIPDVFDA